MAGKPLEALKAGLLPSLRELLQSPKEPELAFSAAVLATSLKEPAGVEAVREAVLSAKRDSDSRQRALAALIAAGDPTVADLVAQLLDDPRHNSRSFRGQVISALDRLDEPRVAELLLARYEKLEPELRPRVVELLTQRAVWGKQLLAAVAAKKVAADALNVNQVRKLLATKDAEIIKQVQAHWGSVREERSPEREKLVASMRAFIRKTPGDPAAGVQVFKNVCGQCHKIHGEGQDVGPDITANGRSDFDQLVSNVFDPSLVITAAYQATTVVTTKGQTITGLLVEDNPQRVVLKQQGGKLETIPRSEVEELQVSKVSLMPEGLEKQLKPQEIADLFAFLVLDKPPSDPSARKIKGAP